MSFITGLKSVASGVVKTAKGVAKSDTVKYLAQQGKNLAKDPSKAKGVIDTVTGFADFFKSSKDATDNFNKLSQNELLDSSIPWYKKTTFKVIAFGSLTLIAIWGVIRYMTNPKNGFNSYKKSSWK